MVYSLGCICYQAQWLHAFSSQICTASERTDPSPDYTISHLEFGRLFLTFLFCRQFGACVGTWQSLCYRSWSLQYALKLIDLRKKWYGPLQYQFKSILFHLVFQKSCSWGYLRINLSVNKFILWSLFRVPFLFVYCFCYLEVGWEKAKDRLFFLWNAVL